MIVHTYKANIQESKQKDWYKFEGNLVYVPSTRPASTKSGDLLVKENPKTMPLVAAQKLKVSPYC